MINYRNMRYDEFVAQTKGFPFFSEEVLNTLSWKKESRGPQLCRWTKTGKLLRLKRGLYSLPENYRVAPFSMRWLANSLYSPSYISLEYALSWYDLIPERVYSLTSITPLKTATQTNPLGEFIYRNLKNELFFGFEELLDEFQKPILMATREKALLDFIYLASPWEISEEFLEESARLQQLDTLDKRRLKDYADKFKSKKISQSTKLILSMI